MQISVLGQGYVGLSLSIAAANAGINVIGYDYDKEITSKLSNAITHVPGISETDLRNLLKTNAYFPTSNFNDVQDSEILVIAVPTPLGKDRRPDLSNIIEVSTKIAENFTSNALIVNESTSYPGTLRNIIMPILENSLNGQFEYASAPERIDPGNNEWKIANTPRVICGITESATKKVSSFYSKICTTIYQAASVEVAEASKIFENTFRQINIALVNELAIISDQLGFRASDAIAAASTKPFGFMPFYPSIGVGGHCIPVDPMYLSYISESVGVEAKFINLATSTNRSMAKYVASRICQDFEGSIFDRQIQIVGISYKPGVSDMREAPSIDLMAELRNLGANVKWYDPVVKIFENEMSCELDSSVDLGIILSPHKEIDLSIWRQSGTRVIDLSSGTESYGWPKYL